jgi:ribosomal protein S18 acetylase RimI-like enzyme
MFDDAALGCPLNPPMIDIMQAVIADGAEILALQKLCYRSEAELTNDFQIPPLLQDQKSIEHDFATQRFLKALKEGRIVGSVRAYSRDGTCHVGRLIVHPALQNRGLGTRLMHEIEATFPEVARFELFTGEKSARNLHLYQKLGYQVFRTEKLNELTTLVFMERLNL